MAKAGRAAAAFVAGLGSGYLSAQQREEEQRRRDAELAMRQAEHDVRMDEAARAKQDRITLANAAQPAVVNPEAATLGLADGRRVLYDMPDAGGLAGSDQRQLRRADEMTGNVTLADARIAPEQAIAVRGQTYPTLAAARVAADTHNAPDAVAARQVAALNQTGRPAEAVSLASAMRQGKAADAQLAATADQQKREAAMRDITTAFAKGGWKALPAIYQGYNDGNAADVVEDGKGGATVTVKNATGEVVGSRTYAKPLDFLSQELAKVDPKLWIGIEQKREETARKAADDAADAKVSTERARLIGEATTAKIAAAEAKAAAGDKPPAGYRKKPNGDLEAIPGGPADLKMQGAFNADTAALTGAIGNFDRLASITNELMTHPGLKGITGMSGALPNLPGSDAANAAAMMNTLKSQTAFGVLQDMRNSSKSGGALGAVSEKELLLLQNNLAALEKAQSYEAMKKSLGDIIKYTESAKERMHGAFNLKHADKPAAKDGAAKPMPKSKAELQTGTTYQTSRGLAKWNGKEFEAQ